VNPASLPRLPIGAALRGLAILLLAAATLAGTDTRLETWLRAAWFDGYQRLLPRTRTTDPVVIVEIDERSLALLGQWPWPRSRLAGLLAQIAEAEPAVIGVDALFPEADRYAPHSLSLQLGLPPADTARLVEALPDSDAVFAQAIAAAPVVLGLAGIPEAGPQRSISRATPILQHGGDAADFVRRYPGLLRNLSSIDAAAGGHGALNAEPERGIVRRLPTLIGTEGGHLIPGFALEILRFLGGGPPLRVELDNGGIKSVEVGGLTIPTAPDGGWWLHFSRWEERPAYSAADVLRGSFDAANLRGRIVLIGYSALGLQDYVTTALGRMPGVETHAEALENALAGRLLARPRALTGWECALLLGLGAIAIISVTRWRPGAAILVFIGANLAIVAGTYFAFEEYGWLVDAANPLLAGAVVFATTLGATLSETQTQRRALHRELAQTREIQARLQGELDAARRIQLGMLPDTATLAIDARVNLAGAMTPAKSVGGDLYDFFLLDTDRLFLLVGDVAGKGLPSALFMALAKAQIRGASERTDGDPGAALTEANRALTRDNPEFLFITLFAAELNLANGRLRWSNAGHDSPLMRTDDALTAPFAATGPPLCAIDDFHYATCSSQLPRGGLLCMTTDGVTEAHDAANALFGADRLHTCVREGPAAMTAHDLVERISAALALFVGDTEPHDDITLLCVRRVGGLS